MPATKAKQRPCFAVRRKKLCILLTEVGVLMKEQTTGCAIQEAVLVDDAREVTATLGQTIGVAVKLT
jgi:hypothetical protein